MMGRMSQPSLALAAFAAFVVPAWGGVRAQEPTVGGLVARLARAGSLDDEAVGYAGVRTETFRLYEELLSRATAAELLALTRHESPIVRGYAVRGLLATKAGFDAAQTALDHLADTQEVTTFSGCTLQKRMAGDVIFELLRPHLGEEQLLDVGETLVRERSPLQAREWALRTLRFRDGMLHELRALAKAGDAPAAIALARYRLASDVPVLAEHLRRPEPFDETAAFVAAAVHADPQLLPALRALLPAARERLGRDNASRLRFWLGAIAAQRSEAAASLLQEVLRQVPETAHKRQDLAKTMAAVLAEHRDPVFDEVAAAAAGTARSLR